MPQGYIAALQRLRQMPSQPPHPSACEFCAEPLLEPHEHVVDLESGTLSCSCIACAFLFERPGQYLRRLPRDARFLPGFDLQPMTWASLLIPVNLAFITVHPANGTVEACYPSAGGVVAAPLDRDLWDGIVAAHAPLAAIEPGLQALLINRLERPHELFIAPVDQCYRLAGLVRSAWSGFSGGPEVRKRVHDFCAGLRGETVHA